MRRLFGTDGIRGTAGTPPLDSASVHRLGRVLAYRLASTLGRIPRVVLGRDTRRSGPELETAIADGLAEGGASVECGGVLPTPAVAVLVAEVPFDAGVVISASHNPWRDNGIKLFGAGGRKLPDSLEAEIERDLAVERNGPLSSPGGVRQNPGLRERYIARTSALFGRLDGLRVVLDCAHGAAWETAPRIFERCGIHVETRAAAPDGANINESCGALHPEALARAVLDAGADVGIAFDGDGDRAILADRAGAVRDGDDVLFLAARHRLARGRLPGGIVVGTLMSNSGLEDSLREMGVELVRTPVGDRYVLEEMDRRGAMLGGEPSGHVLLLDRCPSGDGTVTSLEVLSILREAGEGLGPLVAPRRRYPQVLVNVRVRDRRSLETVPAIVAETERARAELGGKGRVLLRYSGTENLLRVMVEAAEEEAALRLAGRLAEEARSALGAGEGAPRED